MSTKLDITVLSGFSTDQNTFFSIKELNTGEMRVLQIGGNHRSLQDLVCYVAGKP